MLCVFCFRSHYSGDCTKYRTAFERKQAAESFQLCVRCLSRHSSSSCRSVRPCEYCSDDHDRALCPLQPWNKGALCAFCLGEHRSRTCDAHASSLDRMTVAKQKRICTRCLSRSHEAGTCASKRRCSECEGRHHPALCPKLDIKLDDDVPPGTSGYNEAVSDEVGQLRQELATVKAECDEALQKLHKLQEDHGGCEAFKQAMQAGTQMSIANALQIADEQCTKATRARDEAQQLLDAELKRNNELEVAANEAIRLTFDFQIWRFRRLAKENKLKKSEPSKKGEVHEVVAKGVKRKSNPTNEKVMSPPAKRSSHSTPISDAAKSIGGANASDPKPLKLQLFMKANLRGNVTQEELAMFIELRESSK